MHFAHRVCSLALGVVQFTMQIPLLIGDDVFVVSRDIGRMISHSLSLAILFCILFHAMKVCNAIFSNIEYRVQPDGLAMNGNVPSSRDHSSGQRVKSVSFSSQLIISRTTLFVRSKHRNVCFLSLVLATCTVNVSLDLLMGLALRFHSDLVTNTAVVAVFTSLTIVTSLGLDMLLIAQFKILHRFGLQCLYQTQHPSKKQVRTLRNILRSTRILYVLFLFQIIYWIGFMLNRYDQRYSFLLYFLSFLPVMAFHVLILDFTKCQVKFSEMNYTRSPFHHRLSLMFADEHNDKERAMIIN